MQPQPENILSKKLSTNPPNAYKDLVKVWQTQDYGTVDTNYKQAFRAGSELGAVLNLSPCFTTVLDIRTQQFDFVSDNAEEVSGFSKEQYLEEGLPLYNSIIYPEDLSSTWKLIQNLWGFMLTLPKADLPHLKFNYDYRMLRPDKKQLRVLAQNSILQSDSKGQVTHIMSVTSDISHWKKTESQTASVLSTASNSCLFTTLDECDTFAPKQSLSKRELEVVKLMAGGYSSKLIAEKLFISFHTVNTHRQKIIEKTNTRNTGGLVRFAIANGLI